MNRLAESTSLYLRQHAHNPVAWEPWDDQALQRARQEQRPILLSIGYSACHWCHVMAHESFEDPSTAQWMNTLFVNIKVDREERPDLDRLYQLAHQLLTGRGGGWPLTVFLDPDDLTPFFAGTYFPPQPRHGLPGFPELLKKVRQWFDLHREEATQQGQQLQQAIASLQTRSGADSEPGKEALDAVPEQLRGNYDEKHGGFGGAPKFPQAPLLGLVQALAHHGSGGEEARGMLHDSLARMALSGLRDHLDGGFFRYCVDGDWTIPHFEKMLYDNAMLLPLYAETGARQDDPFLQHVAEGIVTWLRSEMLQDNGGFSASIDADADGEEGGFHVWQRSEIEALLKDEDFKRMVTLFGLDRPPNFEGRAWHLLRHDGDTRTAPPQHALDTLLKARARRVPPATDTKQLTTWNALCIEGLARAGTAMQRPEWLDLAESAMAFVRNRLWNAGRLYAVYAGGRAQFPAYLDDHAALLSACLALLEARWRDQDLAMARKLGDTLLERFMDSEGGGFFFTAAGSEAPVQRLRPLQDDALPSGNGVAARGLLRLGHLVDEPRYLDAARAALASARQEMERYPLAHAALLSALDEYLRPGARVIVQGDEPAAVERLCSVARSAAGRGHRLHCYAIGPALDGVPGIPEQVDSGARARAFVCHGTRCLPPTGDPDELAHLLEQAD